jgi:hypothetical protein
MADAPWRCSQCGTVNEPVANSCRTCGKWPSLFDLQDSLVEDADGAGARTREPAPVAPSPVEDAPLDPDAFQPDVLEPETFEPETFEAEPFDDEPGVEPYELESEDEPADSRRRTWLGRFLVPIIFALIVLVNVLFGDR